VNDCGPIKTRRGSLAVAHANSAKLCRETRTGIVILIEPESGVGLTGFVLICFAGWDGEAELNLG
jgi:hypothetical protein